MHNISELPTPTDERVKLREVPEKLYIVRQFSGNMGTGGGHDASAELERANTEKGVKADGGALAEYVGEDAKYLVAKCVCPLAVLVSSDDQPVRTNRSHLAIIIAHINIHIANKTALLIGSVERFSPYFILPEPVLCVNVCMCLSVFESKCVCVCVCVCMYLLNCTQTRNPALSS